MRLSYFHTTRDTTRATALRGARDNLIWHTAQSGSDWFDHNVYLATLVFANGACVSETVERRGRFNVSEHDEPTYDRAATCRRLTAGDRAR